MLFYANFKKNKQIEDQNFT